MKNAQRDEYLNRDLMMKMLSDEEIAAVSMAESAPGLTDGEEYIDLTDIGGGVRRAHGPVEMAHVLPRRAVSEATWNKILSQLWADGRDPTHAPDLG
jgi:hypothetical protein